MVIYTSARDVGTSGGCLQLNFIVFSVQATMLLMFIYIYMRFWGYYSRDPLASG